tara:strand:- start:9854 stop:11167 length:1314 start_codon:yes stop_codon:yes gene_type:complete
MGKMKKPSKRSCTVCPKKHDDADLEDEIPHANSLNKANKKSKGSSRRHKRGKHHIRRGYRSMNRNMASRINAKKQASLAAASKRAVLRTNMAKKRSSSRPHPQSHPQQNPVVHHRPTALRCTNHWYGFDKSEEVYNPRPGDVFTNLLSGEVHIFNKEVWNLVPPSPGPRAWWNVGGMDRNDMVQTPREGDLYIESTTGKLSIYQNGIWNDELIVVKKLDIVKSNVSKSIQDKLNNMVKSDINNLNAIETIQLDRLLTNEISLNKNIKINENVTMNVNSKEHKNDIKHSIIQHSDVSEVKITVPPQGEISVNLSFKIPKETLKLAFDKWIKYVDNEGETWQTIIGINYLKITKDDNSITNYHFTKDNMSNKYPIKHDVENMITDIDDILNLIISEDYTNINLTCKLFTFKDSVFHPVKFNDLADDSIELPQLSIHIPF